MFKRIIVSLVAVAMILGLLSTGIIAAETQEESSDRVIREIMTVGPEKVFKVKFSKDVMDPTEANFKVVNFISEKECDIDIKAEGDCVLVSAKSADGFEEGLYTMYIDGVKSKDGDEQARKVVFLFWVGKENYVNNFAGNLLTDYYLMNGRMYEMPFYCENLENKNNLLLESNLAKIEPIIDFDSDLAYGVFINYKGDAYMYLHPQLYEGYEQHELVKIEDFNYDDDLNGSHLKGKCLSWSLQITIIARNMC